MVHYPVRNILWLGAASMAVGAFSASLAFCLKHLTEHFEGLLAQRSAQHHLIWAFPVLGLGLIYVLRQHIFRRKQNKGIKEVFESIGSGQKLPAYKITSHFINGFLTVIFGGSTGIEVSTVVSTAAIGSNIADGRAVFLQHKNALLCAGIAAGITVLFNSPLAGILFCAEVVCRKKGVSFFAILLAAIAPAMLLLHYMHEETLLALSSAQWHYHALPYFMLVALFAAVNSVYLTKSVLFFKKMATKIHPVVAIVLGGLSVSVVLFRFPLLYGDSYAAIKDIAQVSAMPFTWKIILFMLAILVVKPIITSLTLAGGGDGGVFAPSLVTGAFTGLLFAVVANHFGADLVPFNFMLVGMAGVLSASIAAPLTAVFLVCGICGSYFLLLPLLLVSFISRFSARKLFAETVYSYKEVKPADLTGNN